MKLRSDTPPAPKTDLHDREESLKHTLREQIAEIAAFLEVVISACVLAGMLLSLVPVFRQLPALFASDGTELFQVFLGQAFNLVIGVEFIKMLSKRSPGSVLEVLLYAIARHMILGHNTALENLLGVGAIGLIFVIRKFCFVPSFGIKLPDGRPAPDARTLAGGALPDDFGME